MSHITHHCRCGKTIHWPRDAKAGDVWVCRKCKTRNRLVSEGGDGETPIRVASKKSASRHNPDYKAGAGSPYGSSPSSRSSPSGSTRPSPSRTNSGSSSSSSSSSNSSDNSNSSSSSGCFIATACYGDYNCTEVLTLRQFRDDFLLQTKAGRLLVATYYEVSPPIAFRISRSEFWKHAVRRILIAPLVAVVSYYQTGKEQK